MVLKGSDEIVEHFCVDSGGKKGKKKIYLNTTWKQNLPESTSNWAGLVTDTQKMESHFPIYFF